MTHPKPHSKVQLELIAADSRFPSLHYTMLNLGRSSCPVPVEWAEFFSKGKHSQFSGVRWGALRAPASTTEQGSPRAPLVVPLPLLGKLQKRPVEPRWSHTGCLISAGVGLLSQLGPDSEVPRLLDLSLEPKQSTAAPAGRRQTLALTPPTS